MSCCPFIAIIYISMGGCIVNWTPRNKLWENTILIHKIKCENVVWKWWVFCLSLIILNHSNQKVPYWLVYNNWLCWSLSEYAHTLCHGVFCNLTYRQVSNIRHTLIGNKIVDHSNVVGAAPTGDALTTSSLLTERLASLDWEKTTARRDEKHLSLAIQCALY